MLSGISAILMYIKPSIALLNKGSTLKATTRAFCLMYFLIKTGKRKFPGSNSSMILSNLFKSDSASSKIKSLSASSVLLYMLFSDEYIAQYKDRNNLIS